MTKTEPLELFQKLRYYEELWRDVPKLQRRCYYCRELLSLKTRTLDHLVPRSRGGTNNINNVVLCCRSCNNAKADLTIAEFVDFCNLYGGLDKTRQAFGDHPESRVKLARSLNIE